MKAWLLLLAMALSTFSVNARNDLQPEVKLAFELFEAMKLEQTNREMIESMIDVQIRQDPSVAPYREVFKTFFNEHLGYESIKYEYAVLYLEVYTTDEIRDLIEFYSSPTGKKFIDASTSLYMKTSRFSAEVVQTNFNELQMMLQKEAERIQQLQQGDVSNRD